MNSTSFPPSENKAFALVVTLIMLVLAAGIAVGLLTSASLDRGTSRAGFDRYQADLAVQNGLEAAKKALLGSPAASTSVTNDDTFLVTRIDGSVMPLTPAPAANPTPSYYYLAKAQPGNAGKIDYYPLFSGGSPVTNQTIDLTVGATRAVATPTPPPDPMSTDAKAAIQTDSSKTKILKTYPELSPWLGAVSTQWIEVVDPNDTGANGSHDLPYQRYSFWIEDLGGYIDASVTGNLSGAGGTHQRGGGTNPNETALFTVFDPTVPNDSGNTLAKQLISNRSLLLTTPTLKHVAPSGGQPDRTQANLTSGLGIDNVGEQDLVPFGYGYPSSVEGKAKTDLKALISSKNVNAIATALDKALPGFAARAGGLPSTDFNYSKNLAANFIDYADASNAPTTDGATYRGVGAFPFLVSAFDLNNWVAVTGGPPGDYFVKIEVTTYLQLWNPHNIPISGNLTIHYENVDVLNVNGNLEKYTPPPDYIDSNFSLQPNEYKVIILPKPAGGATQPQTYSYDWGPTPPATAGPTQSQSFIPFPQETTKNTLTLSWNGKLADRTYKNVTRSFASVGMRYNNTKAFSKSVWKGNAAPPIYPTAGSSPGGTPGDPRISYYLDRVWTSANYDTNSSWGGRVWLKGSSVEMKPSTWPDGGHDSTLGFNPTNATTPDIAATKVLPAYSPTGADARKWISRLSTKGSLDSLTELGNVFDPGQWNYDIPALNASTSLPDIPNSASGDPASGGGYTLCIGRPEFSKFDKNGQRAWQLLDVFSIAPLKPATGLINLNTASVETLRALVAGIILDHDPAIAPAGTLYPPKSSNSASEADVFAQAVVNSRPLLSTAQLQTITNANSAFFANPDQWKNETASNTSSAQPTEWNDPGREELFSKILGLTSVRSRNFRIFVTGQALSKNGAVLSTVTKSFQVFLKPTRNVDGSIKSQRVNVTYEGFL